ncbi:MAG: hypothetical protein ACOC5T_03855 [Elusimicrobiota bacterium]
MTEETLKKIYEALQLKKDKKDLNDFLKKHPAFANSKNTPTPKAEEKSSVPSSKKPLKK